MAKRTVVRCRRAAGAPRSLPYDCCDDFANVVGRPGQDITEATDTNVVSGKIYRYRVYTLKPAPEGPRGTGVSNVVTVEAQK